jgi:hypothetical protein
MYKDRSSVLRHLARPRYRKQSFVRACENMNIQLPTEHTAIARFYPLLAATDVLFLHGLLSRQHRGVEGHQLAICSQEA